jgi:hypothetical protein
MERTQLSVENALSRKEDEQGGSFTAGVKWNIAHCFMLGDSGERSDIFSVCLCVLVGKTAYLQSRARACLMRLHTRSAYNTPFSAQAFAQQG